jgi:peptidoglycan/xylan/chitin deacetylase (PgdA/CDA1 family)
VQKLEEISRGGADVASALAERDLPAVKRRAKKAAAAAVLPRSLLVCRGPSAPRGIALTFDDGPTEMTHAYLETLSRLGVKATFFVIGELCSQRPDDVAEIARRGHELGGHGYTHRPFSELRAGELGNELARTQDLLPATPGNPRKLVRPPQGALSLTALLTCAIAGFTTVLWSHDSGDCRTECAGDVVRALVNPPLANGAIVLLHDGQSWTLDALPEIVGRLRKAGHELVTVGQFLGA